VRRLTEVFQRDHASFGHAATHAALWNLHRVTAIKDEVWVAHLLTSEEKQARDRERYNIRPELGDQVVYRHINRPEFVFRGFRFRFKLRSRPWMLRLMRHFRFLRRALPRWHAEERHFRDWYYQLVEQFPGAAELDREGYQAWVDLLRLPEQARGFREVRYPQMRAAQEKAEEVLSRIRPRARQTLVH
jgi:indolepyruvate ferredoxin oxidoreductase